MQYDEPELTAPFLFRLEEKIQTYLDISDLTDLILQLDKVRYIDCISLGKLLFLQKAFEKQGKTLYLSGINSSTQKVLEQTGLIRAFNLL